MYFNILILQLYILYFTHVFGDKNTTDKDVIHKIQDLTKDLLSKDMNNLILDELAVVGTGDTHKVRIKRQEMKKPESVKQKFREVAVMPPDRIAHMFLKTLKKIYPHTLMGGKKKIDKEKEARVPITVLKYMYEDTFKKLKDK